MATNTTTATNINPNSRQVKQKKAKLGDVWGMSLGAACMGLSAIHNTMGIADELTAAGYDQAARYRERAAIQADIDHNELLAELNEQLKDLDLN